MRMRMRVVDGRLEFRDPAGGGLAQSGHEEPRAGRARTGTKKRIHHVLNQVQFDVQDGTRNNKI